MLKERVVVFGDAIIAIIITIIVLELPIKYATNGAVNSGELLRAIGIYFISFCFVANLWFQTAYAFNQIEKVKNNVLVVYMLLLFLLSLVPSATRLLIEDTNRQTVFFYGVLTLIVTMVMRRLIVTLTKQSITNETEQKRRVDELNRQDIFSFLSRIVLLVLGYFFVQAVLVIYLILPILAFLQNVVDREEDAFVDTLETDQRNNYYEDRKDLWGNSMKRYSQLLRESLKDGDQTNPQWREEITKEWQKRVNTEMSRMEERLEKTTDPKEKEKLQQAVDHLKKQQEGFTKRMEHQQEHQQRQQVKMQQNQRKKQISESSQED